MITDYLRVWKDKIHPEEAAKIPEKPVSYSDSVPAKAFNLPSDAKIVFVKDKTLAPVLKYSDLPSVELTAEEQTIVNDTAEQIKAPYFDGDHIFVSSVKHDHETNTVFVEAKKGKYSLLTSMNRKKFPEGSPILAQDLYGAGVLVPLVTNDKKTVLLQSSKVDKPYTTVAGYVQPKNDDTILVDNETGGGENLILTTAKNELMEELLSNKQGEARVEVKKFTFTTICFRKPPNGRGFVEFFVAAELDCNCAELINIIKNNEAHDAREHTGVYQVFNLDPSSRSNAFEEFAKNNPHGRDIYGVIVDSASQIANGPSTHGSMPGTRTGFLPSSIFSPPIPKERFTEEYQQSEGLNFQL